MVGHIGKPAHVEEAATLARTTGDELAKKVKDLGLQTYFVFNPNWPEGGAPYKPNDTTHVVSELLKGFYGSTNGHGDWYAAKPGYVFKAAALIVLTKRHGRWYVLVANTGKRLTFPGGNAEQEDMGAPFRTMARECEQEIALTCFPFPVFPFHQENIWREHDSRGPGPLETEYFLGLPRHTRAEEIIANFADNKHKTDGEIQSIGFVNLHTLWKHILAGTSPMTDADDRKMIGTLVATLLYLKAAKKNLKELRGCDPDSTPEEVWGVAKLYAGKEVFEARATAANL